MRRLVLFLIPMLLLLSACTSGPSDTNIPDPPNATVAESVTGAQAQAIIAAWKKDVPEVFKANAVKSETIIEKVFTSTATVQEVADFYQKELIAKGWIKAPRMPNVQSEVLVTGYEAGNFDLVIGAFDASKFGGSGTVIYIAKGSR